MSIAAINAINGDTVTVYRAALTDATGGQTSSAWTAALTGIKLELMPVTNETKREVFGVDAKIEVMAFSEVDIRRADGIVSSAGLYTGQRFRVQEAKPFRKFTLLGLIATTEAIP